MTKSLSKAGLRGGSPTPLALAAILSCAGAPVQAAMTWEIENRFPLLSDNAFQSIAQELPPGTPNIEARLLQLDHRNAVKHLDDTAWSNTEQRHDAARILKNHANVVVRSQLGEGQCTWSLTTADGSQTTPQLSSPCATSKPIRVELDQGYIVKAVRQSDGATDSAIVMPRRYLIVAAGDSFTSGEGNPDYPAVFRRFTAQPPSDWATGKYPVKTLGVVPAEWMDVTCHRSLFAWPTLYALRLALSKPDTVVQYASFACSGAEVIDGFLLPQQKPPGTAGVKLGDNDGVYHTTSQQQALAKFLCGHQTLKPIAVTLPSSLDIHLERYGKVERPAVSVYGCQEPAKPDEVFVQFGGNDTKFGNVVRYIIKPQPLVYGPNWFERLVYGWFLSNFINARLEEQLAPIAPADAQSLVDKLPQVYELLDHGLKVAGIAGSSVPVKMLLYPDPTVSAFDGDLRVKELNICNARTRDGNRPMQSALAEAMPWPLRHDSALWGVNPKRLLEVKETYIPSLRSAQINAISTHQWRPLDSTPAMVGYDVCAGSLQCEEAGAACPNADRVRWDGAPKEPHAPNTPPWAQIQDFKAYDPEARRGLRYANDALLASARLNKDGDRVLVDWVSGSIHPTASVHARIASKADVTLDQVSAGSPKKEPPQVSTMPEPPDLTQR